MTESHDMNEPGKPDFDKFYEWLDSQRERSNRPEFKTGEIKTVKGHSMIVQEFWRILNTAFGGKNIYLQYGEYSQWKSLRRLDEEERRVREFGWGLSTWGIYLYTKEDNRPAWFGGIFNQLRDYALVHSRERDYFEGRIRNDEGFTSLDVEAYTPDALRKAVDFAKEYEQFTGKQVRIVQEFLA